MRLFAPEISVGPTEGFSPDKDIFGRKSLADGMSRLLAEVSQPTVIALDAQWGAGKTTFLKMWAGQLRSAGFPVVYFDAFENDYSEDAFSALAAQIVEMAQSAKKAKAGAVAKFTSSAISVGKVLLRTGVRTGVKVATLNTVEAKDAEEAVKVLSEELGGLADKAMIEMIQSRDKDREKFDKFRKALSELSDLLSPAGDKRPIVIIVDELDRCRPVFALEILEKIKHFFSVSGVHFVLGVHLGQLQNSVKAAYGFDIDANLYLQKFIQFTIFLSEGKRSLPEKSNTKFVAYVADAMEFENQHKSIKDVALTMLVHIAEHRAFGFRTIERIFTALASSIMFKKEHFFVPEPILVGLCIIKISDPHLFLKAKFGSITFQEVSAALSFSEPADVDEYAWRWSINWWKYCLGQSLETDFSDSLKRHLPPGLRFPEKVIPYTANQLVDALNLYKA